MTGKFLPYKYYGATGNSRNTASRRAEGRGVALS